MIKKRVDYWVEILSEGSKSRVTKYHEIAARCELVMNLYYRLVKQCIGLPAELMVSEQHAIRTFFEAWANLDVFLQPDRFTSMLALIFILRRKLKYKRLTGEHLAQDRCIFSIELTIDKLLVDLAEINVWSLAESLLTRYDSLLSPNDKDLLMKIKWGFLLWIGPREEFSRIFDQDLQESVSGTVYLRYLADTTQDDEERACSEKALEESLQAAMDDVWIGVEKTDSAEKSARKNREDMVKLEADVQWPEGLFDIISSKGKPKPRLSPLMSSLFSWVQKK